MSPATGAPTRAELDGALRKSAVVWLTPAGHPTRLVWGVFSPRGGPDGTLLVACGGSEQQVPGLVEGADVTVVVARPGARTALCALACTAHELAAPEPAVLAALTAARRNAGPGWSHVFGLDLVRALGGGGAG